jgi:phosphopantothenoylcysteine decarboxylase/phosphopantothenate--cysteine ligase
MRCIVTAGPTYEPLDEVRRLTNFSTGRLGVELANFLVDRGYEVRLLFGALATWHGPCRAHQIERFTTVADLRRRLEASDAPPAAGSFRQPDAVFHAAAVSDFRFGRIFEMMPSGEQRVLTGGKIPTRSGPLLAELVPTPKLILELRDWFPRALLVGWKYEVEGTRATVIERCRVQLRECRSDLSVANGPAYGAGFAVVGDAGAVAEAPNIPTLCAKLEEAIRQRAGTA